MAFILNTTARRQQTSGGGGAGDNKGAVRFDEAQTLTADEQLQARRNIVAMANTPSGDPMHYMYEIAGATYNAATGFWELNGLTDLTTDEIRRIYTFFRITLMNDNANRYSSMDDMRTNFPPNNTMGITVESTNGMFKDCHDLVALNLGTFIRIKDNCVSMFENCRSLQTILSRILVDANADSSYMFQSCSKLRDIKVAANSGINIENSPLLSTESVLYFIKNSYPSSTTRLYLHPDAYDRAMADAEVQAALEKKPLITLAQG